MLVDPLVCYFCALLSFFVVIFPLVMEKYEKTCINTKTNDFDQRMACRAPICWSKYTTPAQRYVAFDLHWNLLTNF